MYNISFFHRGTQMRTQTNKRVGRPRQKWIHETFKQAWDATQTIPYTDTDDQRETLFEMARRGTAPFHQKSRKTKDEIDRQARPQRGEFLNMQVPNQTNNNIQYFK